MKKYKSNKIIIHCGYPKAASATIINDMIKINKIYNIVDVNEDPELLHSFEEILNLDDNSYQEKKKILTKIIKKNLKKGINFFCYERVLNINLHWNKKILFFKRLKLIFLNLEYDFKISIFIRNQSDMLISTFKEGFLRIAFKKLKYFSFKNYISSIKKNSNQILFNNLNYYNNLKKINKIIPRKNIYIGLFEELTINKPVQFTNILKFCEMKSFNLNLLSNNKYNDSNDKKFMELIQKRLFEYLINKKKLSFKTFINFIEIFIKMLFLQKTLNKFTKLDFDQKKKIKQIFKASNKNLKYNFQIKTQIFDKYYLDLKL